MRPRGNSSPVRAGIYCRLSLAIMGDTTKVEDQERICRELCKQLGWEVHDVYTDNSRSAWQKNRKRPEWERMLLDVEAGHITAIVTYHGDRLVRQPRDLEKLIDLAEGKGVMLASPTGTRNLSNRDDRAMARVVATFAENESAAISDRRKMQYERWRREGRVRPGGRGGRPFGFQTDGLTHVPGEVVIIRDTVDRLLAGEGILSVCRDLGARGVLTPAGNPFNHDSLRKMLRRSRYAGLMPDGVSKAAWEPVLDLATWQAVCAVLAMRGSQFAYATSARRWLLSGIAECGVVGCASPLQIRRGQARGGKPGAIGYGCVRPGCRKIFRSAQLLDAYVSRRVVNRLASPANPAPQGMAAAGLATQYAALEAQRRETEEAVKDWQATPGRVDLLMARLDSIDARLAELRELAAGDARARVIAANEGLSHEEFAALPLATRRALVSACYRVIVLPASKRGPGFRTEDVRLVPRA